MLKNFNIFFFMIRLMPQQRLYFQTIMFNLPLLDHQFQIVFLHSLGKSPRKKKKEEEIFVNIVFSLLILQLLVILMMLYLVFSKFKYYKYFRNSEIINNYLFVLDLMMEPLKLVFILQMLVTLFAQIQQLILRFYILKKKKEIHFFFSPSPSVQARNRATSVYVVQKVIPMLPNRLSEVIYLFSSQFLFISSIRLTLIFFFFHLGFMFFSSWRRQMCFLCSSQIIKRWRNS